MTWFNIGSLLLGLIAWLLPIINLVKYNKAQNRNWIVLLFASMSACAVSVLFQIVYQEYLVRIEDWSAIMDTAWGVLFVSAVLIIVTIALNFVVILKYRKFEEPR